MEKTLTIFKNQPFEPVSFLEPGIKTPILALISNVDYTAERFPETFQVPSMEIRKNIPVSMLVKIIVDWNRKYLIPERFWVEVTNITTDRNGELCYFGVARNDTFVASYDTPVGPFYPRHICDFDMDAFLEKY